MRTPARNIQEMCGCSTKNFGTFRRLVMSCSFSCAISLYTPLWKNLYRIAILQTGGSNYDDLFPWLYPIDRHIALVRFAERDLAQMRHPFAAHFTGHENRIAAR